jgi:ATP-dependent Clp protease ATP-binding subunit ClpX
VPRPTSGKSDNCSFCGRPKEDVNLLIAGVSGHICDACIDQAYNIIKEELKTSDKPFSINDIEVKTPMEIKLFSVGSPITYIVCSITPQ